MSLVSAGLIAQWFAKQSLKHRKFFPRDVLGALKKPLAKSKAGYMWVCGCSPHTHIPVLLSQLAFF